MYTTTYDLTSINDLTPAEAAFAGGVLGTVLAVSAVLFVFLVIAWWKIFQKAGEKGWKSLIPIYNVYILFKICGIKNWFWGLLGFSVLGSILMAINPPVGVQAVDAWGNYTIDYSLVEWGNYVPYIIGTAITCAVSIASAIVIAVKLAKAFGKGVGFTLGLIFLSGIFYLILGFGSAKYNKKAIKA